MMQKVTFVARQSRWILAHCPRDGEEVIGGSLDEVFAIPNGEASWWYCPACHGWHVMIASEEINNCQPLDAGVFTEIEQDREAKSLREEADTPVATRPVTIGGLTPTRNTTSLWEHFWLRQDQISCGSN